MVPQLFLAQTTSCFSHVLANINNFESSISKCCCGSRKSMKSLVRHPRRRSAPFHFLALVPARINISNYNTLRQPSLSQTNMKKRQGIPSDLELRILVVVRSSHVFLEYPSNYTHFRSVPFCKCSPEFRVSNIF